MRVDLPYRPCVGIAVFDDVGRVLLGERIGYSGEWQLPQGGIDKGERAVDAAFRELREETGVRSARLIARTVDEVSYDIPAEITVFKGKYRGQRQFWFAFEISDLSEINVHTKHAEFQAHRFAPLSSIGDSIVSFKRDLYRTIGRVFSPLAVPRSVLHARYQRKHGDVFSRADDIRAVWR